MDIRKHAHHDDAFEKLSNLKLEFICENSFLVWGDRQSYIFGIEIELNISQAKQNSTWITNLML